MMTGWAAVRAAAAAAAIGCAVPCAGQVPASGGGAAVQPGTAADGQLASLLRMIASPDKKVRKNAAKMLGGVKDPRAVDAG
jgi:HEAT repeat protein